MLQRLLLCACLAVTAVATAHDEAPAAASTHYGPTRGGETLYSIAGGLQVLFPNATQWQIAVALQQANVELLPRRDSGLQPGSLLKLPDAQAVAAVTERADPLAQKFREPEVQAAIAEGLRVGGDLPALQQARRLTEAVMSEQGATALALAQSLVRAAPYRFAGTPAYDRAVDWALQALQQAGLKHVRTEPVTVPHWVRGCAGRGLPPVPGAATTPHCPEGDAVVHIVRAGAAPQPLAATALGGSTGTPEAGIHAPVLMVTSLEDLARRPLTEVKDRIVFFNTRMARREDGSGYGEAVTVRARGAAEAARRGAVGVVIRSIGTNAAERTAHTGGLRYDAIVRKIPAASLAQADADLLEQQMTQDAQARLYLRLDSQIRGTTSSRNVLAEIPGRSDEIVLLVAHLDSWDNTPGANDDAAGTGIVIAALQALAGGGTPLRTLRVLLTANEEFGLSGAEAYAHAHAADLPRHTLAMEADFGSGAVRTLNAGVAAVDWPRVQQMALALKAYGVEAGHNASRGGPDLKPLFERGVPVLAPRQDGSLYFDVHHTPLDGIDRLDAAGIEQAAKVFALLAWTAANAPETYARGAVTVRP